MATRVQLSLYVPPPAAGELERVRAVVDPVQHRLIPAHVTLCREDELAAVPTADLVSRLSDARVRPVTLRFGRACSFLGHGILLPCTGGEEDFHELRAFILGSAAVRRHPPHVTLAHPRNPRSAANSLANAEVLPDTLAVTFTTVNWIEQAGDQPWRVLRTFALDRTAAGE